MAVTVFFYQQISTCQMMHIIITNTAVTVATAFSATIAEFIETHRRGKAMLYKWYKYNMIREGK